MTILYFIIALGLLVFIHELGHFLMAKSRGIGVEKFSIGFGPKIFSYTYGETTYMISLLPLGGYVKLHGEDPQESDPNDAKSFSARPATHKFAVVFAGPFMNLLLAAILMPIVFMIGRSEPAYWQESPVIMNIQASSPATKAGLQIGDRILSVNEVVTNHWKGLMQELILRPDEAVTLEFQRDGQVFVQSVRVGEEPHTKGGYLGVEPLFFVGNEAIVDGVISGSAASKAGFLPDDEIIRINGELVRDWTHMSQVVNALGGKTFPVEVKRGGTTKTVSLTPSHDKESNRWLIGIRKDFEKRSGAMVVKSYPFFEAISLGTQENIRLAGMTFAILKKLFSFQLSYKSLGGPIRIAQASGAAAKTGFANFLYFMTFLSFQLGILNLLPIPVLDGGHILFMGIEKVIRRPVPEKVRAIADQTGMVLLLSLMVLVTLHDVDSIWGFGRMLEWVKNVFS